MNQPSDGREPYSVDDLRRLIEADVAAFANEQKRRAQRRADNGDKQSPDLEPRDPQDTYAPESLRAIIEGMDQEALSPPPKAETPRIERYRPFPGDALPGPIRRFVESGAESIGCAPSYVMLPMLAGLAGAIGNSRQLRLKRGWDVPAILWTAIVGESGTSKTPAFRLAMQPFDAHQAQALERHQQRLREYEVEIAEYRELLAQWKSETQTSGPPPTRPVRPQAERSIVGDASLEALVSLLSANPRGLLMARDDLAGWFFSLDPSVGGNNIAHWRSMFKARRIIIDRLTRGRLLSFTVDRAAVSVTGGIRPELLRQNPDLRSRLLVSWPTQRPTEWTDADVDPQTEADVARLIARLYELQPEIVGDAAPQPAVVQMTDEARIVWIDYYNADVREHAELENELRADSARLREYAARLALVVHCVRWAADELQDSNRLDGTSMRAGIQLAEWFKLEARRIRTRFSEQDHEQSHTRLIELIERKGGSVTPRDLMRSSQRWSCAADAEASLDELCEAGFGRWQIENPTNGRGRPSRRFVLYERDRR